MAYLNGKQLPFIFKKVVGDVSDTTATRQDVASGKYFYEADGHKRSGQLTDVRENGATTEYVAVVKSESKVKLLPPVDAIISDDNGISASFASIVRSNNSVFASEQNKQIKAENIRYGCEIFGVQGTYEGGGDNPIAITMGEGNESYCYVQKGTSKYYTAGNAISLHSGDTLSFYANYGANNKITIDGDVKAEGSPASFDLVVGDEIFIVVHFEMSAGSHAYIDVVTY